MFASVIGDDANGRTLLAALGGAGLSTEFIVIGADRQTLSKQRLVANGRILARFDQGTTAPVCGTAQSALCEQIAAGFRCSDAVLVSDYAYGAISDAVLDLLGTLLAVSPRVLVVDARWLPRYRSLRPTAIKPNCAEASALLGIEPEFSNGDRGRPFEAGAERLLHLTGASMCVVTLDYDGAVLLRHGQAPYTGAGDRFAAALTLALAIGAESTLAVDLASAASEAVAHRDGTVACSAANLLLGCAGR